MPGIEENLVAVTVAAALNVAAFIAFGHDKAAARRRAQRVPESTLFWLAMIGGSIGAIFGMYSFRHKTLKPAFRVGLPLILLIQILALAYWLHQSGHAFASWRFYP